MGRRRLYKILKWINKLFKVNQYTQHHTRNKLEFRRAAGTNGSGCYRNQSSIAVKTIITIFVSMKSVLIYL